MGALVRLMTAIITQFDENLEVDYKATADLASFLVQNGSEGLVVCGTTGESPTLTDEEKVNLYAAVQKAVGDKAQVWAGVGSNDTLHSIEMAKEATKVGVYGVMAVAPYYNKPTQEGLYRHFKAVADATTLPVMLYNIPGRSVVNILPETVARLAKIDNVVALKESSGNMDQLTHLKMLLPDDFIIYSGDDSLTLPMMALGAQGVVSVASHIIGKELNAMVYAFAEGRTEEALKIHMSLFDVFKTLFITTSPIPLKEALKMWGKSNGVLRLPLCEASEKERQEIAQMMKNHGLM
ncbi:MAG: 4-hydroxy-tetrahydrodipicolinate synthase [Candidatus Saccharibacteria bacterium]